ncbi:bacillithiol biosynthesis cysteine-adding enzyme BshC [Robertkochia marina]|uniref:Putative cysteine ligase BshC n=1 Tax=Robertkochia marina TaxID=1227945 RepID=A0A4S3LZC5_9FLAO|nr:bacillithiol biosynthesis cysteine-adding enzyme BshC [Robertkochia marina]THD65713.1 bacillithiol biosynthesis cysteine-adding enzyme BshC [Robertkochia marina]TRZ46602.1 bacillithiol biosynthesis cysteine-adding enzyme BshC [Robertkochia marina]
MTLETINFEDTGFFTDLICDYLAEHPTINAFYNRYPSLESFEGQIQEKADFDMERRRRLVAALETQYAETDASELTRDHIALLANAKTFTITTGHQLNLFTGPLYFLYKIISVVKLTETLKERHPDYHFVPVYWMATEDHDFDEINFFNFNGKKFQWQGPKNEDEGGAVGRMPTLHLEELEALFRAELGPGKNALYLAELFKKAYLNHEDLTSATRFLANQLFAEKGLVIIDGDDAGLKREFLPHMKADLLENRAYHEVTKTIEKLEGLSNNYKVQVNPREINLFYLDKGVRDRVIFDGTAFGLADGTRKWSRSELISTLEEHPERFSPNVMLRPLYQEVILPNLCYIGGGGELAYWLELKSFFKASEVAFPMLLLRDSVLLMTGKQRKKLEKLHISLAQLFLDEHSFINRKVREISDIEIDLSEQRAHLVAQFSHMYEIAEKTDKSFLGAVKAQEVKQLKGLDHLEKRLLKAQKRKLSDQVARMMAIRNELFPNESLQERTINFAQFYKDYGSDLIDILFENLDPLDQRFKVITL